MTANRRQPLQINRRHRLHSFNSPPYQGGVGGGCPIPFDDCQILPTPPLKKEGAVNALLNPT